MDSPTPDSPRPSAVAALEPSSFEASKPSGIGEGAVKEISATTVGRMLGLASVSDLRLVEGKLDLLGTKMTTVTVRLEKMAGLFANLPTGSDMERIDVQIGALRAMMREALSSIVGFTDTEGDNAASAGPARVRSKIVSNVDAANPVPTEESK